MRKARQGDPFTTPTQQNQPAVEPDQLDYGPRRLDKKVWRRGRGPLNSDQRFKPTSQLLGGRSRAQARGHGPATLPRGHGGFDRPELSRGCRRFPAVAGLDFDQRVADVKPSRQRYTRFRSGVNLASIREPDCHSCAQVTEADPVIFEFLQGELIGGDGRVLEQSPGYFTLRTAPEFEWTLAMEESFAPGPVADKYPQHKKPTHRVQTRQAVGRDVDVSMVVYSGVS